MHGRFLKMKVKPGYGETMRGGYPGACGPGYPPFLRPQHRSAGRRLKNSRVCRPRNLSKLVMTACDLSVIIKSDQKGAGE